MTNRVSVDTGTGKQEIIPLSPAEEARIFAGIAPSAEQEIKYALTKLDEGLPRFAEDIIEAAGIADKMPELIKQKLSRKKELREQLRNSRNG